MPGFARLGLPGQCALLAAVTLAVYLVAAPIGYSLKGADGCLAAAVAAGLTLFGTETALVATRRARGPSAALRGMLVGMMLRLGVPLFGSLAIKIRGGAALEGGALYYLIVFYLVTLAIEIALEVCRIPGGFARPKRARG